MEDELFSSLRVVGWDFFYFYSNFDGILCKKKSEDAYQIPRFATSDRDLHCLHMSHKKDSRSIYEDSHVL